MKKGKKILIIVVLLIAVIAGGCFIYVNDYYHSEDVEQYLVSDETVTVEEIDDGYYFDGPGEETAIIFYPGAKVEYTAYSELMYRLAQAGYDCYMLQMPGNIAFLGINRAEGIIEEGNYENYYLMGHSLGGVAASVYAGNNSEEVSGLIYLASYSSSDLSDTDLRILSIYGSLDGVLQLDNLEESREMMPSDYTEIVIEGGNHGQFGSYGFQDGDNEAAISQNEQIQQTLDAIIEFLQ